MNGPTYFKRSNQMNQGGKRNNLLKYMCWIGQSSKEMRKSKKYLRNTK